MANRVIIGSGYSRFQDGTFVSSDGTSVLNNSDYAIDPGADVSARYFVQRDYIDNVAAYRGRMVAAANAAFTVAEAEFMTAL